MVSCFQSPHTVISLLCWIGTPKTLGWVLPRSFGVNRLHSSDLFPDMSYQPDGWDCALGFRFQEKEDDKNKFICSKIDPSKVEATKEDMSKRAEVKLLEAAKSARYRGC
jgi:hypothetical protein